MSKANCKWCAGTGIDPDFMDACKCTMEEIEIQDQDPEGPSEAQVNFLERLFKDFSVLREKFLPDSEMVWVTSTPTATGKGMSKKIDLLKSLITLVRWIVAKREFISDADLAMILAKIERPTTSEWITKTINRINGGIVLPKKGEKAMGHPLKDLIQKKMRTDLPWLSAALVQNRKETTTILVAIDGLLTEMKANREAMTPEFIEAVRTVLNDTTAPKMRSINTLKIEMHKILS